MSTFKSWPAFADDEINTVRRVLQSGKVNYWTGEEGQAFERAYAKFFDRKHAVALANGTAASPQLVALTRVKF